MMNKPVDCREGYDRVWKDPIPFADRLIGGDEDGAPFVSRRDEFEENTGLGLILGDIGKVIEDQQIEFVELGDGGLELQFATGNLQFLDQICGSGEHDPRAVLDQRQANGGGKVALSAAGWAKHEDICALGQPAIACGHSHYLRLRDHRNSVEVEAVHGLAGGQVRFCEITGDPAVSAFSKFLLCDGGQETRGRPAFLVGLLGELWPEGLDGGQPQVVQHDAEAGRVNGVGGLHARSPAFSADPTRAS